jgi:ribosome biogenesis protein MAK21
LIDKKFIKYDGNPLRDFTVARFLERFIYRNPKVNKLRPQYEPRGLRKVPVNSTTYLEADVSKVPIEERFFYKYFKDKKSKAPVKKEENEDESDVESVGDEEFEEIMGNYFKQTGALASDDEVEEDDIDFAANIKMSSGKKGKKGKSKADAEDDEDEDDEADEPADFDDEMEGAYDNSDLDDEEALDADDFVEMGDDDDLDFDLEDEFEGFDEFQGGEKVAPRKAKTNKKSKLKSLGGDKMFLPAEQFSEMLDENADLELGGTHTYINKDRADLKQLKWETDRDRWVKGYKKTSKTNFKSQKSKKRKFN